MDKKRAFLIINPISGTWDKKGLEARVRKHLEDAGISVHTEWTQRPGHATELGRHAVAQGFDMVIAAGGDGTINETAAAMSGTGVPLAIIPCGSGNGLARHLSIPVDVRRALDVIVKGTTQTIDHGIINGLPFFCTCGVGFDAMVSHKFAQAKRRGKFTYISTTIKQFFTYKPQSYSITVNGETTKLDALTIAVANASQYGNNAYIAPRASISDGLLDVTIVHKAGKLRTSKVSFDLMMGRLDHNSQVSGLRTPALTIERDEEGPVHIDGEPMMMGRRLDIYIKPSSLIVFSPFANAPIRPFISPIKSMGQGIGYSISNIFKK